MSQAATLLGDAAAKLDAAGIDDARREARLLLGSALGRAPLDVRPDTAVTAAEAEAFMAMLSRRLRREPISHILGRREFWSLEFEVGPDVLDPRPDSETLVEAVLARAPDRAAPLRLLDLGTGSGCLMLALLSELPRARGLAIDASEKALAIAERNAARLNLADRATFRKGNWLVGVEGPFDMVVSNPPYIETSAIAGLSPEVREFEPHAALDGGADGLDCYRLIIAGLSAVLAPGALVAFEVGAGQAAAVGALLAAKGFNVAPPVRDLGGIERCVLATSDPTSDVKG